MTNPKFNPRAGMPLPVQVVTVDNEAGRGVATSVMPVAQLLQFVLDPRLAEDPARVANDPRLQATAELRREVQRLVTGAKAKNAISYARYLVAGEKGDRPTITPPVTLYHPDALTVVDYEGLDALEIPFGDVFVCIDGETQRIAWEIASVEMPSILRRTVPVLIHYGMGVNEARQGFYDLNTLEVKPNAAVAITMDTQDQATRITRALIQESDVLRDRINTQSRQLKQRDTEVATIGGVRGMVITTLLGVQGLQIGSKPVSERLPEDFDADDAQEAVLDILVPVFDLIESAINNRLETVVAAPAVLAGIGVLANRAMPEPLRDTNRAREQASADEIVDLLEGVNWNREDVAADGTAVSHPWVGICGKLTPSGRFSIGGPKEVGYTVAAALEDPNSAGGRQIR